MIVVLNDTTMSISEKSARSTTTSPSSCRALLRRQQEDREKCSRWHPREELAKRLEEHAKGMITPSTLFEESLQLHGPIDGHNLDVLIDTLTNVMRLSGPQFLHVVTRRGRATSLPRKIR